MKKLRRLFYFAPINCSVYESKIRQKLLIGAATRKIISVVKALRSVDVHTHIVSSPILGKSIRCKFNPAVVLRQSKVPITVLPTISLPWLSRVFSIFTFGYFSFWHVRRIDKVIFYNYYFEYIIAALILQLKGNQAILDIEDGPRIDENNFRGWVNRISLKILIFLCDQRYLVASTQIGNMMGSKSTCNIYGALTMSELVHIERNFSDNEFRIIYGGTLCSDTGLGLFCQAMLLLKDSLPKDSRKLKIVITGFGGEIEIATLAVACAESAVLIDQKSNLTVQEYRDELLSSHAGLCLKMPDSNMGDTTFPSKVVEIAAAGLLLISTRVSDVPLLFGCDGAILLDDATPENLCTILTRALLFPQECAIYARRGHELAVQNFSATIVGNKINKFIFT